MKQFMKRRFLLLLCAVMLLGALAVTANAATVASGNCGDDLTWVLDDAGTLTISGAGPMSDYFSVEAPWYNLRESIKSVKIADDITSIGMFAFEECINMTSITVPSSVSYVGVGAFEKCSNLTDIYITDIKAWANIPWSLYNNPMMRNELPKNLYLNGELITDLVIPDGVTTIGDQVFSYCHRLKSVVIPEGVTSIGVNAFSSCSSLKSVTIPASVTVVGIGAFANSDNVKCIYITDINQWLNIDWADNGATPLCGGNGSLYLNGELLTDLVFPEGTTTINAFLFSHCNSLERVTIPEGVTTIGTGAFGYCKDLKDIALPESLKAINYGAFEGCGLINVTIPDGVTTIGDGAFMNCPNLISVTLPDSVTELGEYVFDMCSSLTSVTLPYGIHSLGLNMFHGCTSLKSITIPDSVTSIGESAFSACWVLEDIKMHDGVTSIGDSAFWNCHTMTSITIPKGVKSIGDGVFSSCDALREIYFMGDAPEIGDTAFGHYNHSSITATAYYPKGNKTWTEEVMQDYGGTITWVPVDIKPDAPTITVSSVAATGNPKVSWDAVDGAAKYQVYRSTSKNGTYEWLATTSGTSLTNKNAETGKLYYYKVRAVSASGTKSDWSNIVSRTCDLPQPIVTITNDAATGKPKLTWNAVEGATKYQIYRSTSKNGTYEWLATTTGTSLTNKNAVTNRLYYYRVIAVHSNTKANSAYSSAVSRICDLPRPVVKISNDAATGKPKLSWNAIEGAIEYQVYRSTDGENWEWLATTSGTTQTNKNAVTGTKYYYRVIAVHGNTKANSAYSAIVSRTCDLPRPTLTVALNSSGKPKLSWNAIEGATKYQVYRSTDGENWEWLATVTGTTQTNKNAVAGTKYFYKVRAVHSNSAANSAYSSYKYITAE